jgi:hypothetical protein
MYRIICRPALAAVLTALAALALAAPALAADPRVPLTADPILLEAADGYCPGFDVLITFVDFNQYIIRSTTADGTVTLRIAGRARAKVTRTDTGESVSFNISGPGTLVSNPDGSFSGDLAGPNLLFTKEENLEQFPEVPTLSYTTGHVTFAADASGQTTSYQLAGGARQTDVCAVLAS